ncbi:2-succinyl-5-enolpyruvyl-6-hydroxy-3-cyclohexene-1-carboxylic-acid synthase [Leucobacter sp. PH1c]|uniref:2-succinyl-5-enolpyruvyl-6-hydroxy-3- cyclohexene-1-carboxylic-acid synthase n=1 Tax=Leucobacter sp. PH1c TaxID=1397278 RepID=UPI0004A7EA2D|nr:2-succinyl-5-enolpyruvyl-6-hydroxy-3-cyclohexene-1-carboxylic-acid synthase [Leucobacter sp. PH1c]
MFAVELLGELIRLGVRDVVVCPGSRSQALALAAAAAERVGAIRLHVRVDERSAAFFALGVARETGLPAPVIVTSGTAVANLLPAALEAHEGRVPMILLTADRPTELRGIRSNQTTTQAGVLGPAARLSLDVPAPGLGPDGDLARGAATDPQQLAARAVSAATGFLGAAPAGPVQLNLSFREPLSGVAGFEAMIDRGFEAAAAEAAAARDSGELGIASAAAQAVPGGFRAHAGFAEEELYTHAGDARTVVLAGADAGPAAESFARAIGAPLLAEAVSGARYGREAIASYATLLDDPEIGGLVERAVVFGHPTLTRQATALLRREAVDVIVVDPHAGPGVEHVNPGRRATVVRGARAAADFDPRTLHRWLGSWVVADREIQRDRTTVHAPNLSAATAAGYKERSAYARAEVAAMREPVTRELLAEAVWRGSWPHDRLVVAASRLVRVLDGLAPGRKLGVHANRGLAGIDGTIATALGVAAASQADPEGTAAAGVTRVLIGDLALLHDVGSLLLPPAEAPLRVQLFVGNDGGGTIFDGLEVAGAAAPDAFERVMRTPHRVALEPLAVAYGWDYRRVETRSELERLLTEPVTGPGIIEVPLDRD